MCYQSIIHGPADPLRMHFLLQQGWLRNLPLDDRKLLLAAGFALFWAGLKAVSGIRSQQEVVLQMT